MSSTRRYYDQNAEAFFRDTVCVDMQALYDRFLPWVTDGGLILDAGCGSGRDTKAFLEAGYRVVAFDASPVIAALASKHVSQEILVKEFAEIHWSHMFDGIWACASLLHLRYDALGDTFRRLRQALKPGGVMYVSFKFGKGERITHGRHFTDLDAPRLRNMVVGIPHCKIIDVWLTPDRRPGREKEQWLNALIQDSAHPPRTLSPAAR
jgi:SAM-dependent methyltransferase